MNASPPRLRRAPPQRNGPIRNPLVREGPRGSSAPADASKNPLEHGVQTAYAVIDEYLRRGHETAHHNHKNQNGKRPMSNERTNCGWFNPWGSVAPFMEQWAAAARMWADAWSPFFPGMRPGWPGQPWPCAPTGFPSAPPPTVSVAVSSLRLTEVTVNLVPGADLTDLRTESFDPPFQSRVYFSPKPGGIHVHVDVTNTQAAGTYYGRIRAGNGSFAGDLIVTITQSHQPL